MLASRAPAWPPGTRHGYHTITLGWYESELIRHADPAGRTLGRFLADEIAGPLGLDLHIGLPDSVDRDRVAFLHGWPRAESLLHLNTFPARFALSRSIRSDWLARPPVCLTRRRDWTTTTVTTCGPSRCPPPMGLATPARSPRLYGSAATGGHARLNADTSRRADSSAAAPTGGVRDKVLHVDTAFSLGL